MCAVKRYAGDRFVGLSTDSKPTNVADDALFYERDTKLSYLKISGNWLRMGAEAFPVGSVFISVVSTNPATLLGYGTWAAFGAGKVLVGLDAGQTEFDVVEETGGEKTHTLITAEIPPHPHNVSIVYGTPGSGTWAAVYEQRPSTGSLATSETGGGGAHNNLQPYIVCYFWKRIA